MRGCLMITYIVVLCLTIIFAIVELGLAADLSWEWNRTLIIFSSPIRARTRYLVFCSTWTILAGIVLGIFLTISDPTSLMAQVIVMFISMIFWLIGAALFTSVIGGSGLHCGHVNYSHRICNIVNSTMAFAWITWSFIFIAFILALWLVFLGNRSGQRENTDKVQTRTANAPPASNTTAPTDQAPRQSQSV